MTSGSVVEYRDWPDPAEIIGSSAVKFTLSYEGPLPACSQSDTRVPEKHAIRKELSYQLGQLWTMEPALASRLKHLDQFEDGELKSGRLVGRAGQKREIPHGHFKYRLNGFCFIPLILTANNLWCELDVLLLRDGDPGHVVSSGGDLDNRIKTLFDALRIPHSANELGGATPEDDQPFFCLLEDDSLITKVCIETQRRLRKRGERSTYVEMRIGVTVIARKVTAYNADYLSG